MRAYLESHEVALLEKAANTTRDKMLVRLLARSGCRISEILELTPDDIDFNLSRISIHHLKTRIRASCPDCGKRLAKGHTFCPGCGNEVERAVKKAQEHRKVRSLPIDEETLELIEYYINKGGPVNRNGKTLLFGINRHRAWQIIRECAERAGLGELVNPETGKTRGISPHRLRDAFAVNAVKHNGSGDGLRLLQEQLGHQSFNTTARYRKVAGDELRQWYHGLWDREDG